MPETKLQLSKLGDLPVVRRLHQSVAVGLAVFMLTLVVLREPFHGYLAEIHISGPATPGLDLDDAGQWLKKAEPHLAVIATPAGEISPKCEIRATFVARHPKPAIAHLDDLAERLLYQYLPDRLQTYRHQVAGSLRGAVTVARQREDAAHQRLESLRQQQLVAAKQQESGVGSQESVDRPRSPTNVSTDANRMVAVAQLTGQQKTEAKLHDLKLELSRRLASHTEEHPEIVTLKSQISALEQQLSAGGAANAASRVDALNPMLPPADGPSLQAPASPASGSVIRRMSGEMPAAADELALNTSGRKSLSGDGGKDDSTAEIASAIGELAAATRDRQAAEQRLSERMQELSGEPTAAQWSASPAHIVTRLGGTPRALTLALASALACAAGFAMFRVTAIELLASRVTSASELSRLLGLPVLGTLSAATISPNAISNRPGRSTRPATSWQILSPGRLQLLTYGAEGFVAIAAGACLLSVMIDPSLAREVLADPFGTLSEVLGRCTG
jgi:hypothetical protein